MWQDLPPHMWQEHPTDWVTVPSDAMSKYSDDQIAQIKSQYKQTADEMQQMVDSVKEKIEEVKQIKVDLEEEVATRDAKWEMVMDSQQPNQPSVQQLQSMYQQLEHLFHGG